MASNAEASLYDLINCDYDEYLKPPLNVEIQNKIDKQRRAVFIVKKKTIATDSLIRKYYSKKDLLDQTEKDLISAKDESKKVFISYNDCLAKCAQLEKDIFILQSRNKELEENYYNISNQLEGFKCHTNQLQQLVKQKESELDGLQVEYKLTKATAKDSGKDFTSLQKEKSNLISYLCAASDIILGKKKIDKKIRKVLLRYRSPLSDDNSDDDNTSGVDDLFDEVPPASPFKDSSVNNNVDSSVNNNVDVKPCTAGDTPQTNHVPKKVCSARDSPEASSEDTGRGSSLAFSDGDKSFHSPDYYMTDSPLGSVPSVDPKRLVDAATSPVPCEVTHRASSPLALVELSEAPPKILDSNPVVGVDVATSPVAFDEVVRVGDPAEFTEQFRPEIVKVDNGLRKSIFDVDEDFNDAAVKPRGTAERSTSPMVTTGQCNNGCNLNRPDTMDRSTSPHGYYNGNRNPVQNSINPVCKVNRGTSPLRLNITINKSTSPINIIQTIASQAAPPTNKTLLTIKEKECLELNSSSRSEAGEDCEIEAILKSMRFNQHLISPMPLTPLKPVHRSQLSCATQTAISMSTWQQIAKHLQKRNRISTKYKLYAKRMSDIKESEEDLFSSVLHVEHNDVALFDYEQHDDSIIFNDNDFSDEDEEPLSSLCGSPPKSIPIITVSSRDDESSSTIKTLHPEVDESNNDEKQHILELNSFKSTAHKQKAVDLKISTNVPLHKSPTPDVDERLAHSGQSVRDRLTYETVSDDEPQRTIRYLKTSKNMSKLDRFRVKMLPKGKIKRQTKTGMQMKMKLKRIALLQTKHRLKKAPEYNSKDAYKKAVKVMAEFKGKNQNLNPRVIISPISTEDLNSISFKKQIHHDTEQCQSKQTVTEVSACYLKDSVENSNKFVQNNVENKADVEVPLKRRKLSEKLLSPSKHQSCDSGPLSIPTPHKLRTSIRLRSKSSSESDTINCNKDDAVQAKTISKKIIELKPATVETFESRPPINDFSSVLSESPRRSLRGSSENTQLAPNSPRGSLSKLDNRKTAAKLRSKCSSDETTELDLLIDRDSSINSVSLAQAPRRLTRSNSSQSNVESSDLERNTTNISAAAAKVQTARRLRSSTAQQAKSPKESLVHNSIEKDVSRVESAICNGEVLPENIGKASKASPPEEFTGRCKPQESMLAYMIENSTLKRKRVNKKLTETVIESYAKKIEAHIAQIVSAPPSEERAAVDKVLADVQAWDSKCFLAGLMKYLKDPARRLEMLAVGASPPPLPAMSRPEQALLTLLDKLQRAGAGHVLDAVLTNIEYSLFALHRTPEFAAIESMSHVFALLCRLRQAPGRLRLFMLDAMYCIQFKAVPLVMQCLSVYMQVLPLAHMGMAKCPLVTVLVYLLHFYKCEDRFNRVQKIRDTLRQKYFYQVGDWNETKILDMFKGCLYEVKGDHLYNKTLRLALIILGKRHGPRWCQHHIVRGLLLPLVEDPGAPARARAFSAGLLGALLRPFPADMRVHSEIVMNQLFDLMDARQPPEMEEAIVTSLIFMSKHNPVRVNKLLLSWKAREVSPALKDILERYLATKPKRTWRQTLFSIV